MKNGRFKAFNRPAAGCGLHTFIFSCAITLTHNALCLHVKFRVFHGRRILITVKRSLGTSSEINV